jgi:hypothetical protein
MNSRGPCAMSPQAKTSGRGGLVGLGVHLDQSAIGLHAVSRLQERKIRRLADGEDDGVGGNFFNIFFIEAGIEAPACVEDRSAFDGAQSCHFSIAVHNQSWTARVVQHQPFFGSLGHFDLIGRHLLAAFETNDMHFLFAAHSDCGSGDVVGSGFAAVQVAVRRGRSEGV